MTGTKLNRSKIKKKLEPLVKEFIKRRDNYTCAHCNKKVEGSNCHASHVLSVGSHSTMQFDPRNIKVLCFHCHRQFWHGDPASAGIWYKETFPENWYYLKERAKIAPKIPTYRLEEMIGEYKELLK